MNLLFVKEIQSVLQEESVVLGRVLIVNLQIQSRILQEKIVVRLTWSVIVHTPMHTQERLLIQKIVLQVDKCLNLVRERAHMKAYHGEHFVIVANEYYFRNKHNFLFFVRTSYVST